MGNFFSIIITIISVLITVALIIGVHELGHAVLAYFFSVKIERFSIGFGTPLLSFIKRNGQQWQWGLWPLGGYVQFCNSRIHHVANELLSSCFDKKPIWVRCIILLAGGINNLMFAWLALSLMFMLGYKQFLPIIGQVQPLTIAATAHLKAGDRFIFFDGMAVNSWQDVVMQLILALGKQNVPVVLQNETGYKYTTLNLSQWKHKKQHASLLTELGIIVKNNDLVSKSITGVNVVAALTQAFNHLLILMKFFFGVLKQLFYGYIPFSFLLGPIGWIIITKVSFVQGLSSFLYFIASFSIAVGLVNLFPLPGLDGGSIIYMLVEKLRGKPISIAMEILLYRLTKIVFFILLIQLILNDLRHIVPPT